MARVIFTLIKVIFFIMGFAFADLRATFCTCSHEIIQQDKLNKGHVFRVLRSTLNEVSGAVEVMVETVEIANKFAQLAIGEVENCASESSQPIFTEIDFIVLEQELNQVLAKAKENSNNLTKLSNLIEELDAKERVENVNWANDISELKDDLNISCE